MSTKRIMAEQVLYYLSAGWPDVADQVMREDVYKQIEQRTNIILKTQQFSVNLPNGEMIPDNLMVATYEDIPVLTTSTANKARSKATLPTMPVSLPRNMGILEIRPVFIKNGEKILGQPMIPLQYGQGYLLEADILLNDLFGQVSYEPSGLTVTFSKDLLTLKINTVDMKLVVFNISQYSETDTLPIPPDYETQIIEDTVRFFAQNQVPQPQPSLVSNYSTPKE
jgi:hypothetical protein